MAYNEEEDERRNKMITLMSYIYWIIESEKLEKMIAGEGTLDETIRRLLYVQQRFVEIKPDYAKLILADVLVIVLMILIYMLLKILMSSSEEKR